MKLNFYDIDSKYTDYLRNHDDKIPYISYENRDKFLCGVVLSINGINYYVPVSSNKKKYLSSFMICDDGENGEKIPISSLRFSFMFPCPIECITQKDLKKETDTKYKGLTQKEYEYCNKHINQIKKKASKIYELAKNKEFREKYNLCNFELLEEKCKKYIERTLTQISHIKNSSN